MPRYHWQASDKVTRIDVKENLQYRYAVLHISPSLDSKSLQALPAALQRHGLVAIPDSESGEPMLRVRGFTQASKLFEFLKQEKLISGEISKKEPLPEEINPQAKTFQRYIKDHSLQLAGAFYLVADAMPVMSGIIRKTPTEVTQGLLWGATSVLLLLCGRKNPDVQMGDLYAKMKEYMSREGLNIDSNSALTLEQLKSNQSFIHSALNLFYEYPVPINNAVQGYGGVQQILTGKTQKNPYKTGGGIGVMTGMWGGLLIPEDKYAGLSAEEKTQRLRQRLESGEDGAGAETAFLDNPVAWVHEKPLRISGIGPIIGNVLTGASALFHDRHRVNQHFGIESRQYELNPAKWVEDFTRGSKKLMEMAPNPHHEETQHMIATYRGSQFTIMSPIFNMVANTLYGMSSKDERSVNLNKEGYLDELLSVAANVYSHVPEAQRGEKLLRFAGFLRSQPDVAISQEEIKSRLEAKIEGLEKLSWSQRVAESSSQATAAQQAASI